MSMLVLKSIFFVISVLSFSKSQHNDRIVLTTNASGIEIFVTTFRNTVKNYPKLAVSLQYNQHSSAEYSKYTYITTMEILKNPNIKHVESFAKSAADAIYQALPFTDENSCIFLKAHAVATYLTSQNILTKENAKGFGIGLCDSMLKRYPGAEELVDSFTIIRFVNLAVNEFLSQWGASSLQHILGFALSMSKHIFAYSTIAASLLEVSIISPPGTIPSASDVLGVTSFSITFLAAVDSSAALQSMLYSNEQPLLIAEAWQGALDLFCKRISCSTPGVYLFKNVIADTYIYMPKSTYVKSISNAFALTMIETGTLTYNNSISEAHSLAETMETLVNDLPLDADLQTRLGVIFTAFNDKLGVDNNILNLYQAFAINIAIEFYAATPVKAPYVTFF